MSNTVKSEITSIDFLIEQLKNSAPGYIGSIAKNIVIDKEGIDKYCSWKKDTYTRNCAFKNEEFELIVLCWEPGHVTAIHGHDGQKCWVY